MTPERPAVPNGTAGATASFDALGGGAGGGAAALRFAPVAMNGGGHLVPGRGERERVSRNGTQSAPWCQTCGGESAETLCSGEATEQAIDLRAVNRLGGVSAERKRCTGLGLEAVDRAKEQGNREVSEVTLGGRDR